MAVKGLFGQFQNGLWHVCGWFYGMNCECGAPKPGAPVDTTLGNCISKV